jgi:hypothetical protein
MGARLKVNLEAIYRTRSFKNYGEGLTKLIAKMVKGFTNKGILYTPKGEILYAVEMS